MEPRAARAQHGRHPGPSVHPQGCVSSPASLPSPVICSVLDSHGPNAQFLSDLSDLALKASCKLMICPRVENRNDRWIQVGEEQPWARGAAQAPSPTPALGSGLCGSRPASVSLEKLGRLPGLRVGVRPGGALFSHGLHRSVCPASPQGLWLRQSPPPAGSPRDLLPARGLGEGLLPCPPRACGASPFSMRDRGGHRGLFFSPSQDEMEFGYTEAPHKAFPVVFDSPRNRGLKDFPYKRILVCGKVQSAATVGACPCGTHCAVLPGPSPSGAAKGRRRGALASGELGGGLGRSM